jgi:hypothetical protein
MSGPKKPTSGGNRENTIAGARKLLAADGVKPKPKAKSSWPDDEAAAGELIKAVFGDPADDAADASDDDIAARTPEGFVHVITLDVDRINLGYAGGSLRLSMLVPADDFMTLHRLTTSGDGFEMRLALYAPAIVWGPDGAA